MIVGLVLEGDAAQVDEDEWCSGEVAFVTRYVSIAEILFLYFSLFYFIFFDSHCPLSHSYSIAHWRLHVIQREARAPEPWVTTYNSLSGQYCAESKIQYLTPLIYSRTETNFFSRSILLYRAPYWSEFPVPVHLFHMPCSEAVFSRKVLSCANLP